MRKFWPWSVFSISISSWASLFDPSCCSEACGLKKAAAERFQLFFSFLESLFSYVESCAALCADCILARCSFLLCVEMDFGDFFLFVFLAWSCFPEIILSNRLRGYLFKSQPPIFHMWLFVVILFPFESGIFVYTAVWVLKIKFITKRFISKFDFVLFYTFFFYCWPH